MHVHLRNNLFLALFGLLVLSAGTELQAQNLNRSFPRSFVIEVNNPLQETRTDVLVYLDEEELQNQVSSFNPKAFVVLDGKTEIASQYNQKDPQKRGIIIILPQLGAGASKKLTIRYKESGEASRTYPKRTQAELSHKVGGQFENRKYIGGEFQNVDSLRVPDEHTDHSYFIRYEGPGWESDKVGYRFYLDWRNGVDVFGKTTSDMVLQQVGLDGFDSYHELQDWGMDILKVGKALGVGSLAFFHEGQAIRVDKTDSLISRITENGAVYSSITTNYWGWQVAGQRLDLESILGIHAGSRMTHQQLRIMGHPDNISTGLTKDVNAPLKTSKGSNAAWGYLASWGKQSLNQDQVGLAVLFRSQDLLEFTEDQYSQVVKLKPTAGRLEYYYLAAWELEQAGVKTEAQFMDYLEKTARELANPVIIRFVAK